MDNASNRSYISEELREDLRLRKIGRETINVAVFGQSETRSQGCDIVEVHIKSLWDPNQTVKITATVVPYICQAINYESIEWEKEEYDAFRDVELADYGLKEKNNKNENISILIGADYYWSFVENDVIRNKNGLVAVKSKLGYLLSGPINSNSSKNSNALFISADKQPYDLVEKCKKFWETESILETDEPAVLNEFNKDISFDENLKNIWCHYPLLGVTKTSKIIFYNQKIDFYRSLIV